MKAFVGIFALASLSCLAQSTVPPGTVYAWGYDVYGQTNVPATATNIIAVAVDQIQGTYTLALRNDGTVIGWGGGYGTNIPSSVTNVVAIAAGGMLGVALRADGSVVSWGAPSATNIPPAATNIIAISAGSQGFLALRDDGTVIGCGSGLCASVPPDATNVVQIAAGWATCLALRADGSVLGWGNWYYPPSNRLPTNGVAIAASYAPWMVLLPDHTIQSFGYYTLSDGPNPFLSPEDATNVVAIRVSKKGCLALRADDTLLHWGLNQSGDRLAYESAPGAASNLTMMACGYEHSIGLRSDGSVAAWGYNSYGQTNVPPWLSSNTVAVACGGSFSLAIATDNYPTFPPPRSTRNPRSQTVSVGSTLVLSVRALGAYLSYQWYLNGTNAIPGATYDFLPLPDIRLAQSGVYTAVVSNPAGSATSTPAVITVTPALDVKAVPAITLVGDVGSTLRLEYINAIGATNEWVTLAILTLTNTSQLYLDFSAMGQPQRLYRAIQLP